MGKYLSVFIGICMFAAGVFLLKRCLLDFLIVVKGIIPGVLLLAGAVSVVAGISEFKDVHKTSRGKEQQ